MGFKTRLFLVLWLAGFVGVLSFQLVDFPTLISVLPGIQGKPLPMPMAWIRVITVLQTGLFVGLAVLVGVLLSRKVGLSSPMAEALASGGAMGPALRPQLMPGILGALAGGGSIVLCWVFWKPWLPPIFVTRAQEFNGLLPPVTRFLYGGVAEELLLRWGAMTFLVWAGWRVLQKGEGRPRGAVVVAAIFISAVVFGMGHLPIAIALGGGPSAALVSYVVVANSSFGLIAGYLYWKKGLESAIIAHLLTHAVLLVAQR